MVKHQCTKLGKNFELCKFYIKIMLFYDTQLIVIEVDYHSHIKLFEDEYS